jgi:hypothetical protein
MKTNILLLTLLVAMLTGCSDDTPSSQQLTGKLKGTVVLYDTHGNRVADRSGVLIQAEGTSYSTRTDAGGNWTLDNIPTQTYSLEFTKDGYAPYKNTSYSFVGGGTVLYRDTVYLSQLMPYTVVIDSVYAAYNDWPYYTYEDLGYVSGHITGADIADIDKLNVAVYISTTPTVYIPDVTTTLGGALINTTSLSDGVSLTASGSTILFSARGWQICGPEGWIQHGRKVYLQAKAYTKNSARGYLDVNSGKWIEPDTGRLSNVVEVVIP